jgi:hypothetical protein
LVNFGDGSSLVMNDPRNSTEEPSKERLHEDAEREEALEKDERAQPPKEDDSPQPFSGSDH